MIDTALILLRNELISFLAGKDSVNVIVDNIGFLESPGGVSLSDSIVITLVNIEEESSLKNQSAVRRPVASSAIYRNPPVYLNLYVLFTCNYSGDNYRLALRRLSFIIQFLQSKTSFSVSSAVAQTLADASDPTISELKFTLELYTLTFEQINHLWGSLGGRQIPFAMYKLRLIAISDLSTLREVPLIEEIETSINKMPNI